MIAPGLRATEQDAARARHWLIEAITAHGVGAKTAAGYGWFAFSEAANNEKIVAIRNARELTVRRGKVDALRTSLRALMAQGEVLTAGDVPKLKEIRAAIDSLTCTDTEVSPQERQWLTKRIEELTPRKSEDARISEEWAAALNKNGGNDKKLRDWINKKCPQLATGRFERLPEQTKTVVVTLLQTDEIGRRLWDFIKRTGGHQAVSAYLKSHPELGKMS